MPNFRILSLQKMHRIRVPGRGGGGVLPYVCILGMCRARDPHFQP